MSTATESFHNRLAVVFDFDRTLAPSSYNTLLEQAGINPDEFRKENVEPLSEAGWDDTLARFYTLIDHARQQDDLRITRDFLAEVGRGIEPYDGVPTFFDRLRKTATATLPDVEIEFYLLSCGFLDVHRGLPFADEFTRMWGSEFHFDDEGEIVFIKQMITFPEKMRYILSLAKGLEPSGPNTPADVYRKKDPQDWHVPLDQIIYVGDGGSDMPVFDLMNDHGAIALGVFEAETAEGWRGYDAMYADRRVQNLAPADYSEGSELMQSLTLAVENVCKLIALRQLSIGE